jgi:hypothetical protein
MGKPSAFSVESESFLNENAGKAILKFKAGKRIEGNKEFRDRFSDPKRPGKAWREQVFPAHTCILIPFFSSSMGQMHKSRGSASSMLF